MVKKRARPQLFAHLVRSWFALAESLDDEDMIFRPTPPRASHKLPPSTRAWLARQYRDPYVKARLSNPANYRSRSAFKLVELDSKWGFLSYKDVRTVIDLGAAPGGWSQVAAAKLGWAQGDLLPSPSRTKSSLDLAPSGYGLKAEAKRGMKKKKGKGGGWSDPNTRGGEGAADVENGVDFADLLQEDTVRSPAPPGRGTIIAVDLLRMEPIRGVKTLQMDFLSPTAETYIEALLNSEPDSDGKAEVILSDMAANFTGNATADVESSLTICESVFQFAQRHLRTAESMGKKRRRGGALILKHFAYPGADRFRNTVLLPNFNVVAFEKPPSSRSESREGYWICLGWKVPTCYLSQAVHHSPQDDNSHLLQHSILKSTIARTHMPYGLKNPQAAVFKFGGL